MLVYIIIAILMFGVLIAVHEFGHFITAKLLGVRVNEFSIGMGPQIWGRVRGETQYSLRALPIGGFCAMEGEEGDSDDPRAFGNKPAWKRLIILVAGAFMNFLAGVALILIVFAQATTFAYPTVSGFLEGSTLAEEGLQVGDRFLSIDGHRVYTYGDASLLISRAGEVTDLVVERDGERVVLEDVYMPLREFTVDGQTQLLRGLTLGAGYEEATLFTRLKMTVYQSIDYVRIVWMGLGDLITGAVGLKDMTGPIGIVSAIGQVGEQSASTIDAVNNILSFVAFIAINLAVMNLLPIPALDGGQILFLAVNKVYTLITKKKLDPKYLGYVNMAGFACLLALMAVVAVNDVLRIVG